MEQQLVDRMLALVRARLEADDLRGAIALIETLRPLIRPMSSVTCNRNSRTFSYPICRWAMLPTSWRS